jgi:hypothetical protein
MVLRPLRRGIAIIAVLYIGPVIAAVWPALHEGFGARVLLWNCVPSTLGLIAVILTSGESPRRRTAAAVFAATAALTSIYFFAAWLLTPLDLDPHSPTTVPVFIFAPVISLGLAILAYAFACLVMMRRKIAGSKRI